MTHKVQYNSHTSSTTMGIVLYAEVLKHNTTSWQTLPLCVCITQLVLVLLWRSAREYTITVSCIHYSVKQFTVYNDIYSSPSIVQLRTKQPTSLVQSRLWLACCQPAKLFATLLAFCISKHLVLHNHRSQHQLCLKSTAGARMGQLGVGGNVNAPHYR